MNGRVYDYNLGRFLSVDPFIRDAGNSQSMNPYSYIMNNPLAGTDPSGYTGQGLSQKNSISTISVNNSKADNVARDNGLFSNISAAFANNDGAVNIGSTAQIAKQSSKNSAESAGAKGKSSPTSSAVPAQYSQSKSKFKFVGDSKEKNQLASSFAKIRETDEGRSIYSQIEGDDDITDVFTMFGITDNVGAIDARLNSDNRSFGTKILSALGFGEKYKATFTLIITLDPSNKRNSFTMQDGVSTFKSSVTRLLSHELGHAKNYSSYGSFRGGTAIKIENRIARQLNPNAPLRHPTKDHGSDILDGFR